MILKHRVKINVVDQQGDKKELLEGGDISMPEKLVRMLFGEGMKILVISPGNSVQDVVISEIADEGMDEDGEVSCRQYCPGRQDTGQALDV